MHRILVPCFAFIVTSSALGLAQHDKAAGELISSLKPFGFLVGDWEADPGAAGETGGFTFQAAAQGHVLLRTNYANYPATAGKPASRHDDVMVIAPEGGAVHADYFDSEGHVIRYRAQSTGPGRVVFVSERKPNEPRYRLRYTANADGSLAGEFAVATPAAPDRFTSYLKWTAHRRQ